MCIRACVPRELVLKGFVRDLAWLMFEFYFLVGLFSFSTKGLGTDSLLGLFPCRTGLGVLLFMCAVGSLVVPFFQKKAIDFFFFFDTMFN